MKIAVLAHIHFPISEPYNGGLEMHTAMLVRTLEDMGHQVVLYAKEGSTAASTYVPIMPESFVFETYPENSLRWSIQETKLDTLYKRALKQIHKDGFDVIINNSLSPVPIRYNTKLPMLTIFHTPPLGRLLAAMPPRPRRHKRFVSVSQSNARLWQPYMPSIPIHVVPNGIDLTTWDVSSLKHETLVWAARITPEKGLHLAIAAAQTLGMPLEISGPVYDDNYFVKQIKPQLRGNIRYIGHLRHDALAHFIAEGKVFLATPQWDEPFGLTVIEAMAAGTPVAALPRGAMPELVKPHVGAVAQTDDVQGLVDAIQKASTVNSQACKTYARDFTCQKMVATYMQHLIVEPTNVEAEAPIEVVEQCRIA